MSAYLELARASVVFEQAFEQQTQTTSRLDRFLASYFPRLKREKLLALNDVSFRVQEGERVGLIGRNGSGKTTLLKLLAGVYQPVRGRYEHHGSIAALYSLNLGFIPEASGLDNVYLRGHLLGLSRKDIKARLDDILEFANIQDWVHQPMSTYSSGMALRLGFAITTAIQPEILLLDEWLGAGDAEFRRRAGERMDRLAVNSSIFVLASQSEKLIRRWCDRVLLIERGELIYDGAVDEGLERYQDLVTRVRESGQSVGAPAITR
ncbi:MAG: ABC transporter ATP-binding protein [Maricaulaceae bacterium]